MKYETANYKVIPSVIQKGTEEAISIIPLGEHARFIDNSEYTITLIPMENCNVAHYLKGNETTRFDTISVKPKSGSISFNYTFTGEQEWVIKIENENFCRKFHVYSLNPDLYERMPYKGDFHVHSSRSDGMEEPAVVAANYRKNGFDFTAITDHYKWEPSKEAIEKYKDVPINLRLFLGEEVHIPSIYIHSVNFGGSYSVNALYKDNKAKFDAEIEEYSKSINVPNGVNALEYAYRKWIHENIKKSGGLSIYVHPNWIWDDEYNVQSNLSDYIFETNCFDAFEVLGGHSVHENNIQTSLYNEQRAKSRTVPIVGSSDSHGTEPPVYFNIVKTIVFSKDLELGSICSAVKDLYSVAVETMPGEEYRIYGPYRLVKYARFLMEYYFPRHDELCFEEGILMKDYICGDEEAVHLISKVSKRIDKFTKPFFGKTVQNP